MFRRNPKNYEDAKVYMLEGKSFPVCTTMNNVHHSVFLQIKDGEWTQDNIDNLAIKWTISALGYAKDGKINKYLAAKELAYFFMNCAGWTVYGYDNFKYAEDEGGLRSSLSQLVDFLNTRGIADKTNICWSGTCPDRFKCKLCVPYIPSGADRIEFKCPVKTSASYGLTVNPCRGDCKMAYGMLNMNPQNIFTSSNVHRTFSEEEFKTYALNYSSHPSP